MLYIKFKLACFTTTLDSRGFGVLGFWGFDEILLEWYKEVGGELVGGE